MKSLSSKLKIQKTGRFSRDIKKLSLDIQREAFEVTKKLADDIFYPSGNIQGLTGWKGIFRVKIKTDYRMLFSFDNENLYLLRIGHRREIYRNLEF